MCGDHQVNPEPGIRDDQIIAVVKGFYRDEKYISVDDEHYKKYCRFWCKSLKRRKTLLFFLDFGARIKSYIYRVLKSRGLAGGSE